MSYPTILNHAAVNQKFKQHLTTKKKIKKFEKRCS